MDENKSLKSLIDEELENINAGRISNLGLLACCFAASVALISPVVIIPLVTGYKEKHKKSVDSPFRDKPTEDKDIQPDSKKVEYIQSDLGNGMTLHLPKK